MNRIILPEMMGDDIKNIQGMLSKIGIYKQEPNGYYDKYTRNIIVKWQEDNNLKPDGIITFPVYCSILGVLNEPMVKEIIEVADDFIKSIDVKTKTKKTKAKKNG